MAARRSRESTGRAGDHWADPEDTTPREALCPPPGTGGHLDRVRQIGWGDQESMAVAGARPGPADWDCIPATVAETQGTHHELAVLASRLISGSDGRCVARSRRSCGHARDTSHLVRRPRELRREGDLTVERRPLAGSEERSSDLHGWLRQS